MTFHRQDSHFFFQKIPSSGLKIICQFVKVDQNVNKPLARALRYIIIKSSFLAIDRDLSLRSFTHIFKEIVTTIRSKCMSKALCFLLITAKLQDYPFFTVFLIVKTPSQNISITLLKISLKSHEHRGCYCWKKLP